MHTAAIAEEYSHWVKGIIIMYKRIILRIEMYLYYIRIFKITAFFMEKLSLSREEKNNKHLTLFNFVL